MSSAISQLACFSSINRRQHLRPRSYSFHTLRPKVVVAMSNDGRETNITSSEVKTALNYTEDVSKFDNGRSVKSYTAAEEQVHGNGMGELAQEHVVTQQKKSAKIHDFCFGIPFGGIVLSGGTFGLIFSRNPSALGNILCGGALLALSTLSLKIWRQGKSSLPFILGQTALSAVLLWNNLKAYSTTKKLFPTGFYGFISVAMMCFYSYVMISGGNPPPKKLKSTVASSS